VKSAESFDQIFDLALGVLVWWRWRCNIRKRYNSLLGSMGCLL